MEILAEKEKGKKSQKETKMVASLLESLRRKPKNSGPKSRRSKSSSPERGDLLELADRLFSLLNLEESDLETGLAPEEKKDNASWLDWGMSLLKELGPKALEMAPELLALL